MKKLTMVALLLPIATALFANGATEAGDQFAYDGIREIVIEAEIFDVAIEGTRSGATVVEVVEKPKSYHVLHTVTEDRLRVWVDRDFSLLGSMGRAMLDIKVPDDAIVVVDNTTGSVTVRTLRSDQLDIETTTGTILIDDVAAAIRAHSTTGSIVATNSAGEFDISSTTGTIDLDSTTGNLAVRSSTGDQRYLDVIGDLNARSSTGDISIDTIQGTLQITTSTGTQNGEQVTLTGNSTFESSTGRIVMDLTNTLQDLEFDLRSTTGSLEVGSEWSQGRLFLSGTGFTITTESSTGSQRFF